ncbi:MAG: amino acid ABC transporter permease [Anaerolineae bacterium]|nr:amino acid ABC transporter permease [Anaerolineae bacterium]
MELSPQKNSEDLEDVSEEARSRVARWTFLYTFPWWALALGLIAIWVAVSIAASEIYYNIFLQLQEGIATTLKVAGLSYLFAFLIGLCIGIIRSSPPRPRFGVLGRILSIIHVVLYNVSSFFVMVMRGLPVLIVLLIFAFVLVPLVRNYLADNFGIQLLFRGSSMESAIIALSFTYGAFLSETFRAGIQSIEKGQIEASRSLGMNYFQTMRYIVLPQAIRRVLPPLGNDFIAMIKDSSLVAILGVRDITQIARVSSGASFRYLETYLTVAVIYLSMTIIGSLLVRFVERRVTID